MSVKVSLGEPQDGLFLVDEDSLSITLEVEPPEKEGATVDVLVKSENASFPSEQAHDETLRGLPVDEEGSVRVPLSKKTIGLAARCRRVRFVVGGEQSARVLVVPRWQRRTSIVLLQLSVPFYLLFLYLWGEGSPASLSAWQAAFALIPAAATTMGARILDEFDLPWLGVSHRVRLSALFLLGGVLAVFGPRFLWIRVLNDTGQAIAFERGTASGDDAPLEPAQWRTFWLPDRAALSRLASDDDRAFCFSGSAGLGARCATEPEDGDRAWLAWFLPERARIACKPERIPARVVRECAAPDGDDCLVVARDDACAPLERSGPEIELRLADAVRRDAATRCKVPAADVDPKIVVRLPDAATARGGPSLESVCADALDGHALVWRREDAEALGPISIETSLEKATAMQVPAGEGRTFVQRRGSTEIARLVCRTRQEGVRIRAVFAGRVASLRAIERFESPSGFEWSPLAGLEQFADGNALGCSDDSSEEQGSLWLDADAPVAFEITLPARERRQTFGLDVSVDGAENGRLECKGTDVAKTLRIRRTRFDRPNGATLLRVEVAGAAEAWQSDWRGTAGTTAWECRPDGATPALVRIDGRVVTTTEALGVQTPQPLPRAKCCYQLGASCSDRRPATATLCTSTGRRDGRCTENAGMTYTCY